ncbi:DUF58 domain-containing protein [Stutzerimonas azotifigens]|uniref:DUF58 domain-containing protein n=1 Tax=Stutzerimonas azotifigens TaxID=291995 RepID=UPI00040DE570|nr:DUF58 domain-containing protein [Stutzerimonas azotifigens]
MSPSPRLIGLLLGVAALGLPLGVCSAFGIALPGVLGSLGWALLLALLAVALADALRLRRLPSPQVIRHLPGHLPLGRNTEVRLELRHAYARPVIVQVHDHAPPGMAVEQLPQAVTLRPGERASLGYRLQPHSRGHFRFERCELVLPSPLGLWRGRRLLALPGQTRVYPDFARLYGAGLQGLDAWLDRLGVRQRQRRGLGLEFHQLREFREGDSLRQIDWKATARARLPIAREYQDERDQQVLFLLDCGRRMRSQDDALSHFDHALNACLLLAHAALRQGDAVGLLTFATPAPRYLAPGKGPGQLRALLNAVYDLDSSRQPADFTEAVTQLLARQRRRALVVVLSNLRDEDDEELAGAMQRLARHHRVLLASLREEVLDRLRQQPVEHFEDALAYCGTLDYLQARTALFERLAGSGIPVLDSRPQALGPELVSRYLDMKKAGAL